MSYENIFENQGIYKFPEGIMGFENLKGFNIGRVPAKPLYESNIICMQSGGIAFLCVNPELVLAREGISEKYEYKEKLSPDDLDFLGNESLDDLIAICIVTVYPNRCTANLLGPVIVDVKSRIGKQFILDNDAYKVRHEIDKDLVKFSKSSKQIMPPKEKKISGRFFAPITPEELASKITGAFYKYDKDGFDAWTEDNARGAAIPITCIKKSEGYGIPWHDLSSQIRRDLSKCEFDLENVNCVEGYGSTKSIIGFRTLSNGLTYLGVSAGGDWEQPVYFILYFSGTELRAYIPTEGNPWNTDAKQAYGNNENDNDNAKKRFGVDSYEYVEADPKAIVEDIVKRIKPRS